MSFCKRTEKENIIKIISFDTITLSSDEVTANKCRSICNFLIRPKAVTQFFFRTRAIDIHDNRFEYCIFLLCSQNWWIKIDRTRNKTMFMYSKNIFCLHFYCYYLFNFCCFIYGLYHTFSIDKWKKLKITLKTRNFN